jgi:hypothetical protein
LLATLVQDWLTSFYGSFVSGLVDSTLSITLPRWRFEGKIPLNRPLSQLRSANKAEYRIIVVGKIPLSQLRYANGAEYRMFLKGKIPLSQLHFDDSLVERTERRSPS